jgi:large subunit ribosomal protein L1
VGGLSSIARWNHEENEMPKRGKRYQEARNQVDRNERYLPMQAIELAKQFKTAKFDETVEVHLRLGVDPRHADQQVRSVVVLPHGLGKTVRILVFAEADDARLAMDAGADYIADDELIKKIQDGWVDFDVAMAVPQMMGKVGRLGRILGPRGLMPNPKAGTVVRGEHLPQVIQEAKAGRVEFRVDKTANLHIPIGKVSFPPEKLRDNLAAVLDAVKKARPAAAKGAFIRRATLTTTMGPGIPLDVAELTSMEMAL